MGVKTRRCAWPVFLENIVSQYLQCLLVSLKKIKTKQGAECRLQLQNDITAIKELFERFMTHRQMQQGVEVLEDMHSLFESGEDFVSVPCEKLRRK